jgi:hypothetical protein
LAAATDASSLATAALVTFLAGTALLLSAVAFVAAEVRGAQRSLIYEVKRVSGLRLSGNQLAAGEL